MPTFINKILSTKFKPIQLLVTGFLILSIVGAILLTLPVSTSNHQYNSFIDALFTSVSAVSTTGLIVVDTGTFYNLFGQIVIIVLVQIGGLGYMLFIILIVTGLGDQLSISTKKLLREAISRHTEIDVVKFVRIITIMTLVIEFIGAAGLTLYFLKYTDFRQAAYSGIFHSISAFCTAGFSIYSDSFVFYKHSWFINLFLDAITILGALGFPVLYDLYALSKTKSKFRLSRLSVHSKIVLSITFTLIILSSVLYWLISINAFDSFSSAFLDTTFQVISASTTTGFNTIDIGQISGAVLFILIILMFIGASPGSTGGGIKTTTFGTVCKAIYAGLVGNMDVNLFRRKIKDEVVRKSMLITALAACWIIISVMVLLVTEKFNLINILFEIVSAFGTVGLSTGITSGLSITGKIIITITMFIGRVGPLAFGLSLIYHKKSNGSHYAETEIIVG